nr:hypothetical protein [Tanacetum cinerariifolium]
MIQKCYFSVAITELETALSRDHAIEKLLSISHSRKVVSEIGDMMSMQFVEYQLFVSEYVARRFILDMGVHYIAGLRMMVGCEVASVSAMTSHVDTALPPPDTISSILYVTLFSAKGETTSTFYPFSEVTDEVKAFLSDISKSTLQKGSKIEAEARCSFVEGARDVAVLDAMLESGIKQGESVQALLEDFPKAVKTHMLKQPTRLQFLLRSLIATRGLSLSDVRKKIGYEIRTLEALKCKCDKLEEENRELVLYVQSG